MKKIIKKLLFITLLFININIIKAADYIWPIDEENAYETYIEYGYGKRNYDSSSYDMKYNYAPYEGIYTRYENHYGVDITGIKGNTYNVVSVVDGTVLTTSLDQIVNPRLDYTNRNQRNMSFDGGGYGNYIVIKEDSTGKCFLYGHLSANSVTLRNGDKVTKGQKIGVMGSSGDSGHMHLHFEVRINQENTTTGKNLVITRVYGLETLDPTNFIGNKAPEKKVAEKIIDTNKSNENEIKEPETKKINEETIVQNSTKIKITNIKCEDFETFGKVTITFDKLPSHIPEAKVTVNGEERKLSYGKTEGNSYIYIFTYSSYDVTVYGEVTIDVLETDEIESASIVNGYLKEYIIPQTYEDSYYYKQGDLNKDGYVDAVDASLALRIYSKLASNQPLTQEEEDQKTRADMNNDGYINSIDSTLILRYYTNVSTSWEGTKQEQIIECDINGDHIINSSDYNILKQMVEYHMNNGTYDAKYDLWKDKIIDEHDIAYFKYVLREYGSR